MSKISLERLKELSTHLGNRNAEFGSTFNCDDALDAANAIRELISLREAPPVAYIGPRDMGWLSEGKTHAYVQPYPMTDSDTALIIRPC